jgi:hypothetical protein
MISLIYFLLASCFLIGCFANIAGNAYGLEMVEKATFGFMLFLIFRGFVAGRKIRKTGGSGAGFLMAEYWLIAIGLLGTLLKFNSLAGAGPLMIVGYVSASLLFFLRALRGLFAVFGQKKRVIRTESILMLLFCSSGLITAVSKQMHWLMFLPGLLIGMLLLLLLFLTSLWRFRRKNTQPLVRESTYSLSPVRSYFYVLMIGHLHFVGSLLGWIPGFQYLDRTLNYSRILELPESAERDARIHCFNDNIYGFFEKRNSMTTAEVDSVAFCLPESDR